MNNPAADQQSKSENLLDLASEQERTFDIIVAGLPEGLRLMVRDRVLVALGLK
jgi:hypothetical protein